MIAPSIFVVLRRDRDLGDSIIAWAFMQSDADDEAIRLNGGQEFGPHVVEEIPPVGAS